MTLAAVLASVVLFITGLVQVGEPRCSSKPFELCLVMGYKARRFEDCPPYNNSTLTDRDLKTGCRRMERKLYNTCDYVCPEIKFQCLEKRVPDTWRCDGEWDCDDGDDERNCPPAAEPPCFSEPFESCLMLGYKARKFEDCPPLNNFTLRGEMKTSCREWERKLYNTCDYVCPAMFQCLEKRVPDTWRCDGEWDCDNGDDERNCPPGTVYKYNLNCTFTDSLFQCPDRCIRSSWQCDGYPDCENGNDELNCGEIINRANVTCGHAHFECPERCIMEEWECDGVSHCEDGYDEEGC